MGNVLFADIYKVETWLCCLQNKQNLFHVRYVNVTYVPCTYVNLCKTIKKIRKSLLSTRNDDQVSEVHLELFQTPEMDIAQKKWRRFHRIWSHLLKKSLMENFIFRAVGVFWMCLWTDFEPFNAWRYQDVTGLFKNVWPFVTTRHLVL